MKKLIILFVAILATQISYSQETGGGDSLVFESTEHNFGDIAKGSDGNCVFTFTNTGDTPAVLNSVKASCGCTTPNWPKEPIGPGETAVIKVHYDTNRVGLFTKQIRVYSNKTTAPIVLTIMGKVLP